MRAHLTFGCKVPQYCTVASSTVNYSIVTSSEFGSRIYTSSHPCGRWVQKMLDFSTGKQNPEEFQVMLMQYTKHKCTLVINDAL